MMDTIQRRALYNLLRMNWLNDPSLSVESWQVEDYQAMPMSELFDRLKHFSIHLDRTSFIAYADECDSPEEFTDQLMGDHQFLREQEDQIYLLLFELWRRLMSEKPSLSVLCHELDEQIYLYDNEKLENPLALQDALAHFILVLNENVDEGIPPHKAFELMSTYCANDIESFLYDFIAEQIDEGNEHYAHDLLDDLDVYMGTNKWFKLLRFRLSGQSLTKNAQKIAEQIFEEHFNTQELDFLLEFLAVMSDKGDSTSVSRIIDKILPLISSEEDFQDLLSIAIDYFHRIDQEQQEHALKKLLERRPHHSINGPFATDDPDLTAVVRLFQTP